LPALRVGLLCCFRFFASGFQWGQVAMSETASQAEQRGGF